MMTIRAIESTLAKAKVQTSILLAPASKAFSTSSFTAVATSRTTCPEQMRCTTFLLIGVIFPHATVDDFAGIIRQWPFLEVLLAVEAISLQLQAVLCMACREHIRHFLG